MNNQKEIKLSSNWTNVGLYGGSILILLLTPILLLVSKDQEFHMGMVVAGVVFCALIGFMVYQFIYVCSARVLNDTIVLKKQFRPAKSYPFDKIGKTSSFRLKRTKYITVEMKNEGGVFEKYLIINSNSLLSFENKDAEQALISLRKMASNK